MAAAILLVDDEPGFLGLARALLDGRAGPTVVGQAIGGEEAVALAAVLGPDLAIVDVHLRGMSGFEAAHRLVAVSPSLRVLMVSAYADAHYQAASRASGAQAFLAKKALSADAVVALLEDG